MDSLVNKIAAANDAAIAHAARSLRGGGLVAFPTETVYGLGADASNGKAVAGIFAAKGRPRFNPLIVHVTDFAEAERHAAFSSDARRLTEQFWPGALTLVLPRRADTTLSELVSAGLGTSRSGSRRILSPPRCCGKQEFRSPRPAPTALAPSAPPRPRMWRRV